MEKNEAPSGVAGFFKALSKGIAGKIALGMLCTALVGAIKDAPAIWRGLRWVCAGIGKLGDQEASRKIDDLLNKGKEVVNNAPVPVVTPAVTPEAEPPKTFLGKMKDGAQKTAASGKEAIEKNAKKLEDKADTAKDELKDTANNVADKLGNKLQGAGTGGGTLPPGGTPPSLPGQQRDPGQQVSGLGHDLSNAATNAMNTNPVSRHIQGNKDALEKRQRELAPTREIYAAWWAEHGPNGTCYNPRCKSPMWVQRGGNGAAACGRCKLQGKAGQFRAFPPPMPMEPPPQFWLWKKKQDDEAAKKEKKP